MNKTRYSATELARNKPMNFRSSGTLRKVLQLKTLVYNQPKKWSVHLFRCVDQKTNLKVHV